MTSLRNWVTAVVLTGLVVLGSGISADAGVRGRSFNTEFDTTGDTFQAVLQFDQSGPGMSYDGAGGFFPGVYGEVDFTIASLFIFALDSSDRFTGIGVSLFNTSIQGIIVQDDFGQIDFQGTVINPARSGKSKAKSSAGGPNAPSK
jgi:hypothetical protein